MPKAEHFTLVHFARIFITNLDNYSNVIFRDSDESDLVDNPERRIGVGEGVEAGS